MFTKTEFTNILNVSNYRINYYIEEGLLKPFITPDGNENFTEEDVINVSKFNFLLRIHVSIGSLIRLKRGERVLKDVIDKLISELSAKTPSYKIIKDFYERLIEDNINFENFEPNIYIPILEELPLEVKQYFNIYPLEMQAHNYPIRRFFARTFDLSIYSLLLFLIQNNVFQWYPKDSLLNNLLDGYLYIGLMLIIEPLLISIIGTTPGKWLLGLSVRDTSDKKLSLSDSYKRTLSIFSQGLGYNIPIYSLYKYYRCYKDCKNGYVMTWDENTNYILKDKKTIRIFTFITSNIILILISIFMSLQLYIPSNQGNLTPTEYIYNCNQIMKRLHIDLNYTLDNNGKWIEKDLYETNIVLFPTTIPDYNLILTDGYVTGIRLDIAIINNDIFNGIVTFKQIAFLGFYGAQNNSNTIDLHTSGILSKMKDDYSNYSYQIGNVRITNSVYMEGYSQSGNYIFPNESEKSKLTMSFLIERVD